MREFHELFMSNFVVSIRLTWSIERFDRNNEGQCRTSLSSSSQTYRGDERYPLDFMTEDFADIHFVQFAGESLQ